MTEMPPSYAVPPPAAPARRGIPTWAWIVGALVLLCVCSGCAVAVLLGGSGAFAGGMAGGQLPFTCADRNPDLGTQACSQWVQEVASTQEFQDCVNELMPSSLTSDSLYDCLVEKGVGPE
jgi:hypothetical protein